VNYVLLRQVQDAVLRDKKGTIYNANDVHLITDENGNVTLVGVGTPVAFTAEPLAQGAILGNTTWDGSSPVGLYRVHLLPEREIAKRKADTTVSRIGNQHLAQVWRYKHDLRGNVTKEFSNVYLYPGASSSTTKTQGCILLRSRESDSLSSDPVFAERIGRLLNNENLLIVNSRNPSAEQLANLKSLQTGANNPSQVLNASTNASMSIVFNSAAAEMGMLGLAVNTVDGMANIDRSASNTTSPKQITPSKGSGALTKKPSGRSFIATLKDRAHAASLNPWSPLIVIAALTVVMCVISAIVAYWMVSESKRQYALKSEGLNLCSGNKGLGSPTCPAALDANMKKKITDMALNNLKNFFKIRYDGITHAIEDAPKAAQTFADTYNPTLKTWLWWCNAGCNKTSAMIQARRSITNQAQIKSNYINIFETVLSRLDAINAGHPQFNIVVVKEEES
jgi:hypothetical protein